MVSPHVRCKIRLIKKKKAIELKNCLIVQSLCEINVWGSVTSYRVHAWDFKTDTSPWIKGAFRVPAISLCDIVC